MLPNACLPCCASDAEMLCLLGLAPPAVVWCKGNGSDLLTGLVCTYIVKQGQAASMQVSLDPKSSYSAHAA